jgi:1-deoxy-D-xylulose-5-phosphate reductoisomerase
MKVPIQLAITDPYRTDSETRRLDLAEIGQLTFERPNMEVFPCLRLAYEAAAKGGTLPAVMNGANEQAVDFFLKKQMNFTDIPYIIERVMESHVNGKGEAFLENPNLDDILRCDAWAKAEVRSLIC